MGPAATPASHVPRGDQLRQLIVFAIALAAFGAACRGIWQWMLSNH
jgi:hypothetical protein